MKYISRPSVEWVLNVSLSVCRRYLIVPLSFRKLADDELLLNIENGERYILPTVDEVEDELKQAPSLKIIKQRISDIFQVLGDFKNRRDPNR